MSVEILPRESVATASTRYVPGASKPLWTSVPAAVSPSPNHHSTATGPVGPVSAQNLVVSFGRRLSASLATWTVNGVGVTMRPAASYPSFPAASATRNPMRTVPGVSQERVTAGP